MRRNKAKTSGKKNHYETKKIDDRTFFYEAQQINPTANKIAGAICGAHAEDIEDQLMQKIGRLGKLVDELAKDRPMEKILRS